jgi:predicted transcriptional regulator
MKQSWTKMPDSILYTLHERSPVDNLILILLARNIESKGRDILSLGYIQTSLGISKSTAQRAIKSLCNAQIIEKKDIKSKISAYR